MMRRGAKTIPIYPMDEMIDDAIWKQPKQLTEDTQLVLSDIEENGYDDDGVRYVIAPKGVAVLAMLDCGLITDIEDRRFEVFWELFEARMKKLNYIQEVNDE